jgi:hypothetical protein
MVPAHILSIPYTAPQKVVLLTFLSPTANKDVFSQVGHAHYSGELPSNDRINHILIHKPLFTSTRLHNPAILRKPHDKIPRLRRFYNIITQSWTRNTPPGYCRHTSPISFDSWMMVPRAGIYPPAKVSHIVIDRCNVPGL